MIYRVDNLKACACGAETTMRTESGVRCYQCYSNDLLVQRWKAESREAWYMKLTDAIARWLHGAPPKQGRNDADEAKP